MSTDRLTRREWGAAATGMLACGVLGGTSSTARAAQPVNKMVGFNPLTVDSCVVMVHVRKWTSPTSALAQTGTGAVLPGGRVITATHLFKEEWTDVEIIFGGRLGHAEQSVIWTGELLNIEDRDVTVLSGIRVPEWVKPVKISPKGVGKGDSLVSFGLSRPGRPRLRGGVVDELAEGGGIVIDVNSSQGDSGGPTFNQDNQLVGVHTGVITRTWEGKWGKRSDVFSLTTRVTDLKQVTNPAPAPAAPPKP